jgi:hypothetical protein
MPILGGGIPSKIIYDDFVHPADFGTLTQGAFDQITPAQMAANVAAFQAAIDAAAVVGTRKLAVRVPAGVWTVPGLLPRAGTSMIGHPSGPHLQASILWGSGTTPVLLIDTSLVTYHNLRFEDLKFIGASGPAVKKVGLRQAPANVYWRDCTFSAGAASAMVGEGPCSEWFIENCTFHGNPAGFEWVWEVEAQNRIGSLDGFRWSNVKLGGQKNAFILRASLAVGWVMDHVYTNSIREHGFIITGYVTMTFYDSYGSENMCNGLLPTGGYPEPTTASISSGTNIATRGPVGDPANVRVGDNFTIRGAGPNGGYLLTTITEINGAQLTLADQAARTVTDQWATNAMYDVVHCEPGLYGGTPGIIFNRSNFAPGAFNGVRFGCFTGATHVIDSGVYPIYDPLESVSYQRAIPTWRNQELKGRTSTSSDGTSGGWMQINSPLGEDAAVVLHPGGPNHTAPWGKFAVYKRDPGGDGAPRLTVDTDGHLTAYGSLRPGTVTSLPTASVAHRGRLLRIEGGSGVADTLHICMKDAAGGYSWIVVA